MDNSLQELENELKRLTPRRLSPGLIANLRHEIRPDAAREQPARAVQRVPARRTGWAWAVTTLAAAAALAVILSRQLKAPAVGPASSGAEHSAPLAAVEPEESPKPFAPATDRYEPVQAVSVLYELKEDGTAMLPDRTEGRQVRYRYVDTYTWKNPANNATLRWSVPRDEVRVIRTSLD